jgi:crotonobetainyl-CoA:carnitine CoA-transferase CaiB-like acyl-CoA transferase
MGGVMGITGPDADHPTKVGPGIGDIFPGALAAVGLLAAVRDASATGSGRFVDVGMYDAVLSMSERIVYQESITGVSPEPQGNAHPLLCPYGVVRTADGAVAIAAPADRQWAQLAESIGRPELGLDARYATNEARLARSAEVYAVLEGWSAALPTATVIGLLAGRVPCGPVNTAAGIAADPHVAARDMVVAVEHPDGGTVRIAGTPIKFAGVAAGPTVRAPLLGEHDDEIRAEIGEMVAPSRENS